MKVLRAPVRADFNKRSLQVCPQSLLGGGAAGYTYRALFALAASRHDSPHGHVARFDGGQLPVRAPGFTRRPRCVFDAAPAYL